jgi:aspartyl-tRNA(Asn)/glutamyl-tRNA(Gln) amidotransferase subunit A
MTELWRLGVAESAGLIRRRELSPVELLNGLLARIDALDANLLAWVLVDRDGALEAARRLERSLARGTAVGPLAGVPLGLKDIFHARGLPTRGGSRTLVEAEPEAADATVVGRLRRRGAIMLGKVTTTEFASSDPSPARNPWNAQHTPGGSSSGSCVAVATGMLPLALGSQTGGSTVRPAGYNGIVGLKPTYGLLSCHGVLANAWSFDTVGILVRSVADAGLALDAAAGFDPLDPASIRSRGGSYHTAASAADSPPRIGLLNSGFFFDRATPEVRANLEQTAAHFERLGATVETLPLPVSFARVHDEHRLIGDAEIATYHQQRFAEMAPLFQPKISVRISTGLTIPATDYVRAQRERHAIANDLRQLATKVDVLLTPTFPAPAPADLTSTGDASYQVPWSYSGLPSLSLPSGLAASGLPLAVQLIAGLGLDAQLLRAAAWCEQALEQSEAVKAFRVAQQRVL